MHYQWLSPNTPPPPQVFSLHLYSMLLHLLFETLIACIIFIYIYILRSGCLCMLGFKSQCRMTLCFCYCISVVFTQTAVHVKGDRQGLAVCLSRLVWLQAQRKAYKPQFVHTTTNFYICTRNDHCVWIYVVDVVSAEMERGPVVILSLYGSDCPTLFYRGEDFLFFIY